ncbi:hypothetical protein ACNKHN_02805 [Shigella flexneri]
MFRRFDEPAVNGDSPDSPFQQKLAALFADVQSAGHQKSGDGQGGPSDPPSAFVAVSSRILADRSPVRKDEPQPAVLPQPVAERGGTQAIPEQTTFEQMGPRTAALTATPQVDKVVLSRLIDITTDAAIDSGVLLERLIAQNPVAATSMSRWLMVASCWGPPGTVAT